MLLRFSSSRADAPSADAAERPAAADPRAPGDSDKVSLASAVEFAPLEGFAAAADAGKGVSVAPAEAPTPRERLGPHRLHVQATRNNTIVTFTMPTGEPLSRASGGSVGFRKSQRSGYEAGYRAAVRVFKDVQAHKKQWNVRTVEMLWNGFGQGREAVFRALQANEGETVRGMVRSMTDKTPLKIGGVRPKKRRRTWHLLTPGL